MTQQSSIKIDGDSARDRFINAVGTGAKKCTDESLGDAILTVDDVEEHVEIKVCGAAGSGPFTVNQIRPAKLIPCVVLEAQQAKWYVMPAKNIVLQAVERERGQHTENPFECMSWPLNGFKKEAKGPFSDTELRKGVEAAIKESKPHEELRGAMQTIVQECKDLAKKHRGRIEELIKAEFGTGSNAVSGDSN